MLVLNHLTGFGAGGAPSLIETITGLGLTANLKLCLDAGDRASWPGAGQKWLDRSGNGYDFFLGADGTASASDPAFNGAAGGLSGTEYWSFDGGDMFRYDAANEAWMETLHKAGAKFSVAVWLYIAGTTQFPVFGDSDSGSTASIGVDLTINPPPASVPRFLALDGSGTAALDVAADTALSTDAWEFLGLTIDEAGGNVSFFRLGAGYDQVGGGNTFNAAYATPSASAASFTMEIADLGNGPIDPPSNGSRMAMIAFWQGGTLAAADFDALFAATRGRFGV